MPCTLSYPESVLSVLVSERPSLPLFGKKKGEKKSFELREKKNRAVYFGVLRKEGMREHHRRVCCGCGAIFG